MNHTIVIACLGIVFIILFLGIMIMAIGGKIDKKYSSKLMMLRVVAQALTIIVIACLYFYTK